MYSKSSVFTGAELFLSLSYLIWMAAFIHRKKYKKSHWFLCQSRFIKSLKWSRSVRQMGDGRLQCTTKYEVPLKACKCSATQGPVENSKSHWAPPACTVPPISTAAAAAVAATETYYFSKCWKIDLSRHIVTQNSSISNHRLPVHCLSAFRQLKEHRKIWSAPGSRAAEQQRWKCEHFLSQL